MDRHHQIEKTVILSSDEREKDGHPYSVVEKKSNGMATSKGVKSAKGLRILLIVLTALSGAGTIGYFVYTNKEQKALTAELKSAVQNNRTKQAARILKTIRRYGYTSGDIVLFSKRLSVLEGLESSWNRVQEMYDAGMIAQAYDAVLPFTLNARYHDRAVQMIAGIRQRNIKGIIQTATTLYAGGNEERAGELLSLVLGTDPANRDAREMLAMIRMDRKIKHIPEHTHVKKRHVPIGDEAYRGGDLNEALKLWSSTGRKADREKVVLACTINKYLTMGESAYHRHDYTATVALLGKAQVFTSLLGIRGSVYGKEIGRYLAMTYGLLGKEELSAQRYIRAKRYLEEALKYEPGNPDTLRGFSILNDQASRLYKRAYAISGANRSEACDLYRDAILIAQKGTDIYTKLKSRITACEQ